MQNRIHAVRSHFGLSQQEFADKLSLTRNFISRIENGERKPSDRTIRDICLNFNVNETWLLTGEGDMLSPPTKQQRINQMSLRLNAEDDTTFYKIIEFLDGVPDDELENIKNFVIELSEHLK